MFINEGDYFSTSTLGYILISLLLVLILLTASFFSRKKGQTGKTISVTQLVYCSVLLALGFILSYIKIYRLPWGGSVTLCSMFFITLAGYFYGPVTGLLVAFCYSLLQFIQGGASYILTPFQAMCDYLLAFTALGLSGFFKNSRHGLLIGYLIAIFARGFFNALGGYLYWMDYMPESFPASIKFLYPVIYNYSYILIEAAITIAIISIPSVRKAISYVKTRYINK